MTKIYCKGILFSFMIISYFAMTTSMTLDLTELRNRISKLKVNPRGNLWATGHFMGKKSVMDNNVEMGTGRRKIGQYTEIEEIQFEDNQHSMNKLTFL
ncbi:hypothetical protein OJAV_G00055930 [Oryzias javanicus]|uniref:Neuromedin B n=1 Tax=Oryzias javanicus TaxID=123683 RepID=A0A3S2PCD9_ORYJA|nr:hypothetical protein OJAV_G00055930 [Oryzias javanicus]